MWSAQGLPVGYGPAWRLHGLPVGYTAPRRLPDNPFTRGGTY